MTTQSTEEAMALLEATRADRIERARNIAEMLAHSFGEVHTKMVRDVMVKYGYVLDADEEKTHWMGAVFRDKRFEWTGKYHTYTDESRNIHERTVKVWRLAA